MLPQFFNTNKRENLTDKFVTSVLSMEFPLKSFRKLLKNTKGSTESHYTLITLIAVLRFGRAASVGVDQFGKKNFPVSRFNLEEPLWMIEITPVLHHSNGGIQINTSTEVVTTREDGTSSIILGLYAAGECTGGTVLSEPPSPCLVPLSHFEFPHRNQWN
jgi:hypothetical protein